MWYKIIEKHVYFTIKAKPNAKETRIVGLQGNMLKLMLKAPPIEGRANAELIRFFAEAFAIPKSALEISSGSLSSIKRLRAPFVETVAAFINRTQG